MFRVWTSQLIHHILELLISVSRDGMAYTASEPCHRDQPCGYYNWGKIRLFRESRDHLCLTYCAGVLGISRAAPEMIGRKDDDAFGKRVWL